MDTDMITIAEAAHRLGLDRSNVLRRARRGDFGTVTEIGRTDGRPSILLVPVAGVEALRERLAAS